MPLLSEYISLKKRYHRSANLERDLDRTDALSGYVVTPRSAEALERILSAVTSPGLSRSWTLTGAYGTGKSSFAHFFLSLCGPSQDQSRKLAQKILSEHSEVSANLAKLVKKMNVRGLVRAVATAQREPISHTVVKALYKGASEFWADVRGRKPDVLEELREYVERLKAGKNCDPGRVVDFATELARASKTGLVIVIDELGKGLEYAALRQSDGDLFLLQQLAELKAENGAYVIGLLHQAFAEYGQSLSTVQRSEWSKIQGRFEDIPFTNSATEALRLISHAIEYSPENGLKGLSKESAKKWHKELTPVLPEASYTVQVLSEILPLHPIAAIALPLLCNRFAQNDRSLFSFLTSDEPFSFTHFLRTNEFSRDSLPTLKLESLYDYFVDVVGANIYSRPHLSRWLEIQGRIAESTGLDSDELRVVKAIGILNLIASVGSLRASQNLIALAMCNVPDDDLEIGRWKRVITSLVDRRIVAYRRQLDELRVWEGSDFNIEQSIQLLVQSDRQTLDQILNQCAPLGPVVAQRHSYRYGTFRFFERRYVTSQKQLSDLKTSTSGADGIVAYWLASDPCKVSPSETLDGKPLVVLGASNVTALQNAAHELFALHRISLEAPELQTDGVARREVRQRTLIARRHLDDVLADSFDLRRCNNCWSLGQKIKFKSWREFVGTLSDICDAVYSSTPVLLNELINRRELTSQGAKARNELLQALIKNYEVEQLGLSGYGPEVSMYRSLLANTGIHRQSDNSGAWEIGAPKDKSLMPVWTAIENYCLDSVDSARPVADLFDLLSRSPFGLKAGILPVVFAALLIQHNDDICIYKDGTFVPVLGPEHFELLVKDPARFAVKHFVTTGLRAQVFKEIEELVSRVDKAKGRTRNASLLSVVKPLIQFVNNLPAYTRKTSNLTEQAKLIRDAISGAKQPDEMLFSAIPQALGLTPIIAGDKENSIKARELRSGLLSALRELQMAYDDMLNSCQVVLCEAFKVESTSCRQALRTRGLSVSLSASRGLFDSFVRHIIDDQVEERAWLTTVLMIIGDRPTESWRDEDVELFTSAVGNFAKRFSNFESLQSNLSPGEGFEPKKITLTQPSGKEDQKILWIELAKEQAVNRVVDEIINDKLSTNPELHDAILTKLAERLLSTSGADFTTRRRQA